MPFTHSIAADQERSWACDPTGRIKGFCLMLFAVDSKFTFVGADGPDIEFTPQDNSWDIRGLANLLRARLPEGSPVGILFSSGPDLVSAWFASLLAGLKPLIMQYPTRKQSGLYWSRSIGHTIGNVGISGIIADTHCTRLLGDDCGCEIISELTIDGLAPAEAGPILPDRFDIIQLSSGTTGFRKAIQFSSEQLIRHVEDYNKVLGLSNTDRIVSWLPLYHDMGYIACFVMPILLGIDVVMMDPVTWTQDPALLYDAIERYSGTTCYMPNFGFEMQSRIGERNVSSMRRWISCSEPVSEATSKKFLRLVGCGEETFFPCYAMAENVFAISITSGCRQRLIDGSPVVSCGTTIPGVDIKIVDGEIWAKSPTSIISYADGLDIRDDAGYYATGDLGEIIDGEIFVSGRQQDLLIQGGRKFMLSDVDLRLNELFPDVRGRAATLAIHDERVGTETPLVLIESAQFFTRMDGPEIANALKEATTLDQVEVAFVPPRFLTKTSSGKFNRKNSRADWATVQSVRHNGATPQRDPREELRGSFGSADWTQPIGQSLDSLSRTILTLITNAASLPLQEQWTLEEVDAALAAIAAHPETDAKSEAISGIRIVSIANQATISKIRPLHLVHLEKIFGCKVTIEHFCLPPSPITLSDLIFYDYFRPRIDSPNFSAVAHVLAALKGASIIITDDLAEMAWLYESTYPVLSHNLERDPQADLISFRWQQYTRNHDALPLTVVAGVDIPLSASTLSLRELERYLDVPIFRIATTAGFRPYTRTWDFYSPGGFRGLDPDELVNEISGWSESVAGRIRRKLLPAAAITMTDLPHFCSVMANKSALDLVLSSYERFCIAGQPSSLPYVPNELTRLGKSYVTVTSHTPDIIAKVDDQFDCLLVCGSWGRFPAGQPAVAVQHVGPGPRTQNMDELAQSIGNLNITPVSGTDWYHNFELRRMEDYRIWGQARSEISNFEAANVEI